MKTAPCQQCNSSFEIRDEDDQIPQVTKHVLANQLPDTIENVTDDILGWAITCQESGRPFRIQPKELNFYRKSNLPIPHLHPDIRHKNRINKINKRKLWQRECDNCRQAIETSFSPDRPEKVLCENCYLEIVV